MVDREEQKLTTDFHKLEQKVLGYEDYVDCSDENFIKTYEDLQEIVN